MAALTTTYSEEQLRKVRADLLEEVGCSFDELKRRADIYTLTDSERAVWETVKNIDYLLDDDES